MPLLEGQLKIIGQAPIDEFYDTKGRLKPHHVSTATYAVLALALEQGKGFEVQAKHNQKTLNLKKFLYFMQDDHYIIHDEMKKSCHDLKIAEQKKSIKKLSRSKAVRRYLRSLKQRAESPLRTAPESLSP